MSSPSRWQQRNIVDIPILSFQSRKILISSYIAIITVGIITAPVWGVDGIDYIIVDNIAITIVGIAINIYMRVMMDIDLLPMHCCNV